MAKDRSVYICNECQHQELRWLGKCPSCGAWNSLERSGAQPAARGGRSPGRRINREERVEAVPLASIPTDRMTRLVVEPEELGRVLGGGIVPGSILLLGGAPGVGKSTLLTMLAGQMAAGGRRVVYVSAEESAAQVRGRAERVGALAPEFLIAEEPSLARVLPALYDEPPALLVVDSIQTVFTDEVDSIPGSVSQIRSSGGLLADFARTTGCAVALIGHVTKDGDLAGPRLLEHLVDAVLYFEPDPGSSVRMIRAFKNRFGATGELAVLEMGPGGLTPVRDASALFLAGRLVNEPGSAITAIQTGSRPFLVELQALLCKSQYATPSRVVSGMDSKRVALLSAILDRKGGRETKDQDVFVKIAGGLRVADPAADLALIAAMASSLDGRSIPADQVLLGEVGLTGELRPVHGLAARLHEAAAHGFRRAVVASFDQRALPEVRGIELQPVHTLRQALAISVDMGTAAPRQEREEA